MPNYFFYIPNTSGVALPRVPPEDLAQTVYCHDPIYANARDGTGTKAILPDVGGQPGCAVGEDNGNGPLDWGGQSSVARMILRFKTGLMGAGIIVNSGFVVIGTLYPLVIPILPFVDSLFVVDGTGTSYPIVPADFITLNGPAAFGSVAFSFPPDVHQKNMQVNLNPAGVALISNVADTVFALKSGYDIAATPPLGGFSQSLLDLFSSGISRSIFDNPISVFAATRPLSTVANFSVTLQENTNGLIAGAVTGSAKLVLDVAGIPSDRSNLEVRFRYNDGVTDFFTAWQMALVGIPANDTAVLDPAKAYTCRAFLRYNGLDPALFIDGTVILAVLTIYTITATTGIGGTITPSGAVPVYDGDNQSFVIAANTHYQISDVYVDGVSVGPVSSYTFLAVVADHTISANFVELKNRTYPLSRTEIVSPPSPI